MTEASQWILGVWGEELAKVLQFLTGEDWTVTWSMVDEGTPAGNCFWWTQPFTAAPDAAIAIGAPALAWSELGARVLQAAGVDLIEQSSARATYIEAIQQAANGVSRALTERPSRPVEPSGGRDEPPALEGAAFSIVVSGGDFNLPSLRVVVSSALLTELEARTPARRKAAEPKPETTSLVPSKTMSVLLDVQMPVSISFGRAALPLREILKLTTGSAVELDRKPDDEVDVIVNNCVIARGEVVVIDGNYGVRITEIISREQRMALRGAGKA